MINCNSFVFHTWICQLEWTRQLPFLGGYLFFDSFGFTLENFVLTVLHLLSYSVRFSYGYVAVEPRSSGENTYVYTNYWISFTKICTFFVLCVCLQLVAKVAKVHVILNLLITEANVNVLLAHNICTTNLQWKRGMQSELIQ